MEFLFLSVKSHPIDAQVRTIGHVPLAKMHWFTALMDFSLLNMELQLKTTSFTPPSVIKLHLLFAHAFT
jgi:hypothetical protein